MNRYVLSDTFINGHKNNNNGSTNKKWSVGQAVHTRDQGIWFSWGLSSLSDILNCSENYLTNKNFVDQHDRDVQFLKDRNDLDDTERGIIIISYAAHQSIFS